MTLCIVPARTWLAILAGIATLGPAPPARAEHAPWIVVEGACRADSAEIERRVEEALDCARPAGAWALASIHEVEGGLGLTIRAGLGSSELGTKSVVVPSCDEALEALALVLAVALTDAQPNSPPVPAARPSSPYRAPVGLPGQAMASPVADEPPKVRAARPGTSVVALGGIDAGTLSGATAYLGGALSLVAEPVELRVAFRYGLGREDETEETGTSERTREDFGALELSVCRGTGEELRLSLCAGGELGLVRVERTRETGADSVDLDQDAPRFAGVLSGWITRRVGALRLELETAGSAVAWGPAAAPRASVRVGLGAGTQF